MQVDVPGFGPVRKATTFRARWRGLRGSDPGDSIVIPGSSVHGFGMDRPLRVVALTRDFVVMRSAVLRPNRLMWVRGAKWMIELPQDTPAPAPGTRLATDG